MDTFTTSTARQRWRNCGVEEDGRPIRSFGSASSPRCAARIVEIKDMGDWEAILTNKAHLRETVREMTKRASRSRMTGGTDGSDAIRRPCSHRILTRTGEGERTRTTRESRLWGGVRDTKVGDQAARYRPAQ